MIKMQVSAEMIMHAFFIILPLLLVYHYRRQERGSVTAYLEFYVSLARLSISFIRLRLARILVLSSSMRFL